MAVTLFLWLLHHVPSAWFMFCGVGSWLGTSRSFSTPQTATLSLSISICFFFAKVCSWAPKSVISSGTVDSLLTSSVWGVKVCLVLQIGRQSSYCTKVCSSGSQSLFSSPPPQCLRFTSLMGPTLGAKVCHLLLL